MDNEHTSSSITPSGQDQSPPRSTRSSSATSQIHQPSAPQPTTSQAPTATFTAQHATTTTSPLTMSATPAQPPPPLPGSWPALPLPSTSTPPPPPPRTSTSSSLPATSEPLRPPDPSTTYTFHRGVLSALTRMSSSSSSPSSQAPRPSLSIPTSSIDQTLLRHWLLLSPTFLLLDSSSHPPPSGLLSWQSGLQLLINLMLSLHSRNQLEWETMDCASRALAECWSIALCWSGLEGAKGVVQGQGGRLKAVLDEGDRTRYKGRALYPVEG